jgi:hypothetical protein
MILAKERVVSKINMMERPQGNYQGRHRTKEASMEYIYPEVFGGLLV